MRLGVGMLDPLKQYVGWGAADEAALRALHPFVEPHLDEITTLFYRRILDHEDARRCLGGDLSIVARLECTLRAWLESALLGPWDDAYFERRSRIGRQHVQIGLPQHYMLSAMNVIRCELVRIVDGSYHAGTPEVRATRRAVGKVLDLELAIMLHTFLERDTAHRAREERLATFGQLVGSIGHELRNPLAVIESSLFILAGRVAHDAGARKHVERIAAQLAVSNRIIGDLLDLIRDAPLDRRRTHLGALVHDALRAVAPGEGVSISLSGLDVLPEVEVDAGRLRQALVHLLSNALEAVGATGRITIEGSQGHGELEIAIEDTGPGVAPRIRERLFEPLATTKVGSPGLGLALVRRIAERHGGGVAYEPRGSGARFVLRLPVRPARA